MSEGKEYKAGDEVGTVSDRVLRDFHRLSTLENAAWKLENAAWNKLGRINEEQTKLLAQVAHEFDLEDWHFTVVTANGVIEILRRKTEAEKANEKKIAELIYEGEGE